MASPAKPTLAEFMRRYLPKQDKAYRTPEGKFRPKERYEWLKSKNQE